MRNAYSRTWIMARTLKNVENEKNTPLTYNMARKTQNLNNEKWTLQDLEYGEKSENNGK